MLTMDLIEVGNVSTTSAAPAGFSEDALLLKSISENKISFQQGRSMLRMGESLRRYARRSIGLEIRDYASLSGFLSLTDVQSSFPPCLAPPSYACFATGSLQDFVRSPGDLRALADIFCAGDVVSARSMLDVDNADLLLPPEYTFPATKTPKPTRSVPVAHFPVPKTPKPTRSVPVAGLEKTSASSLNAQKKFLGPGERAEVAAAASLTQSSSLGERGLQHAGDSTSELQASRLSRGESVDAALSAPRSSLARVAMPAQWRTLRPKPRTTGRLNTMDRFASSTSSSNPQTAFTRALVPSAGPVRWMSPCRCRRPRGSWLSSCPCRSLISVGVLGNLR
jgi:hypothetical protein